MQVHSSHEFGNQSDLKRLWDRNKAKHCIFCHPFHKDVLILMSQLNTDKSVYLCCRLKNYLHILTRTVIGLKGKDVVVFAVEKLITSKLYEPFTNKRNFNVDEHIGMAISGLISDARQIVETSRLEAANYRAQYGTSIPLKYLNDRISMYMHAYTLYSAVRPYGCSIILSSYQDDNPEMYMIDPSGVSYGYYGCAIGKAKQAAKTEIEKLKLSTMEYKDIVREAARIIYLVHDELKDKQFELEMSWVGKHTNGKHEKIPNDIKIEAESKARQALADDSDSDTEEM